MKNNKQTQIIFAGAGPGAPDLITLRAKKALEEADLIVYAGSLVNPEILSYAKADCEKLDSAGMNLEQIIAAMKNAAEKNKQVVRLHTGDPSIYGAIAEQMRELDSNTIYGARVFVDQRQAAQAEAGDIMIPVAQGELEYDHVIGDLGELAMGEIAGRTCYTEITVFKSVGLAMQDAVTAAVVYACAVDAEIGHEITLN